MPRVALLLSLALLAVPVAPAGAAAAVVPLELEEELDVEAEAEVNGDGGGEECGEAEEELEAGELSEGEASEICTEAEAEEAEARSQAGSDAPAQCLLRSASAHGGVDPRDGKLKLTISYTTRQPTAAKIEISKGADRIASIKRHLGRSGVLRFTKKLAATKGGGRLAVRITLPAARGGECPPRRLVPT